MKTTRLARSLFGLSLLMPLLAGCSVFTAEGWKSPSAEPAKAETAPEDAPTAPRKMSDFWVTQSRSTRLDQFELPIAIDTAPDMLVSKRPAVGMTRNLTPGGVRIRDQVMDVTVYKPGTEESTLALAKTARAATIGCDHTIVREEADFFVVQCKKDQHYFLMQREIGGITYACEGEIASEDLKLLEPAIASCRTLRALREPTSPPS